MEKNEKKNEKILFFVILKGIMTERPTTRHTTAERTTRRIIATGFSRWKKDMLKDFVENTNIPLVDSQTNYNRSDYINAISSVQPISRGYRKWKKSRLRDYVSQHEIQLNITRHATHTRSDYINAIKHFQNQFKNLNKKNNQALEALARKFNLRVVPTGNRGQILKRDFIKTIKEYVSLEEISEVANWREVRSFRGNLINLEIIPQTHYSDLRIFLNQHGKNMIKKVTSIFREKGQFKLEFRIKLEYIKESDGTLHKFSHQTRQNLILREDEIKEKVKEIFNQLIDIVESKDFGPSGLTLNKILVFYMNFIKYTNVAGSSYIELTPFIKYKKAVINVLNKDDQCVR